MKRKACYEKVDSFPGVHGYLALHKVAEIVRLSGLRVFTEGRRINRFSCPNVTYTWQRLGPPQIVQKA